MPVLVENQQDGITVFSDPVSNFVMEFAGKGDGSGNDVQYIPDKIAVESVAFLRMINQGVFRVVEASDEVNEKLQAQAGAFKDREQRSREAAEASIDQKPQNDLVMAQCVGPNNRGSGQCAEQVAVREKSLDKEPPLCNIHKNLKTTFVFEEDLNATVNPNKPKPGKWITATVDPRQKAPVTTTG